MVDISTERAIVVIEAPGKVDWFNTHLRDILPTYSVIATRGVLFDIPQYVAGRELSSTFLDTWEGVQGRPVEQVSRACKRADVVYIATDADAEGELIASHVSQLCAPGTELYRLTIRALTKRELALAFENATPFSDRSTPVIARRLFDYCVGYSLSDVNFNIPISRTLGPAISLVDNQPTPSHILSGRIYNGFVAEMHVSSPGHVVGFDIGPWSDWGASESSPPGFLNLRELLTSGSRDLQLSHDEIYEAAQELYETGVITYIRTASTGGSAESSSVVARMIEAMGLPPVAEFPNENFVGGHQAILPTEDDHEYMSANPGIGARVYRYIVARSLEAMFAASSYAVSSTASCRVDVAWRRGVAQESCIAERRGLILDGRREVVECIPGTWLPNIGDLESLIESRPLEINARSKLTECIKLLSDNSICPPGQLLRQGKRLSRYLNDDFSLNQAGQLARNYYTDRAPRLLELETHKMLNNAFKAAKGSLIEIVNEAAILAGLGALVLDDREAPARTVSMEERDRARIHAESVFDLSSRF